MWRHVSNVPGTFGTLETCRHILSMPLTDAISDEMRTRERWANRSRAAVAEG